MDDKGKEEDCETKMCFKIEKDVKVDINMRLEGKQVSRGCVEEEYKTTAPKAGTCAKGKASFLAEGDGLCVCDQELCNQGPRMAAATSSSLLLITVGLMIWMALP